MDDRKLLELAAKAAYLGDCCFDEFNDGHVVYYADIDCNCLWNPLESDGDALRLAVKCGINISMDDCSAWYRMNDSSNTLIEEYWGGDYDPCYRRAIVRAAASIVEQMK